MNSNLRDMNRRNFIIGLTTAFGAGFAMIDPKKVLADEKADNRQKKSVIRDHFWLWGHETGSHNNAWNLPAQSQITPVEAAHYMGIPNMIMVRYGKNALSLDKQYVLPYRSLREVVWSVVGASGRNDKDEITRVLQLPGNLPNMTGVMMDDFFRRAKSVQYAGALSTAELATLCKRLSGSGRGLKLWVVLYDGQLDWPVKEHLELCDKVTYWTWKAENLKNLENNFAKMEKMVPQKCGKVLGCYMWDYGGGKSMPLDMMKYQCETGLCWLKEGRIEGMIFLASCICDLDIEAVEWTRKWISEVGNMELKNPA
jgi:hypothetical protein